MESIADLTKKLNAALAEKAEITLSAPKTGGNFTKIKILPKCGGIKSFEGLYYQFSFFKDNKVFHENYTVNNATKRLSEILSDYKNCSCRCERSFSAFINKKGMVKTVYENVVANVTAEPHDHKKNRFVDASSEWLKLLHVTDESGNVRAEMRKKFIQIDKFIESLSAIEGFIPQGAEIIDFGCGKGYVTFALYEYFWKKGKNIQVTGVDIKPDVIEICKKTALTSGFSGMRFVCGRAEQFPKQKADAVICLHACNTATDYAIAFAVKADAKVIMCAPCCQQELFGQINENAMPQMLRHGVMKERFAALLTDTIRTAALAERGYRCDVSDFVDAEHTPKNLLIRAVKTGVAKNENLAELVNTFGVKPKLLELLL
ncbi:MAG: SAM-dependent methyltransferase [Clostridiales bacterium]|jgi:SAM-dependent methyltransferase|nr:SAM-dependent methyltransferase [Clostridiales bacterium]